MNIGTGKRGTGNTFATSLERGISREGTELEEFIRLLGTGPMDLRSAPKNITLPQSLYAAMKESARKSLADGLEHGGIFGSFDDHGAVKLGILYAEGNEFQINYSKMPHWPGLKLLGRFHTHLYQILDRGPSKAGWAGGGQSGDDIANFYYRDEHASITYAQTKWNKWKIYFMLKPQEYVIPGTPKKMGLEYDASVRASVERGLDRIDATQRELARLSQGGAFVFYTSEDSPWLARQS